MSSTEYNMLSNLRRSVAERALLKVAQIDDEPPEDMGYLNHLMANLAAAKGSFKNPGHWDDVIMHSLHGVIPIGLTSHSKLEELKAKAEEIKWNITHPLDFAKSLISKRASLLEGLRSINRDGE